MLTDGECKSAKLKGERYVMRDGGTDPLELRVGASCRFPGCPGDETCPAHENGPKRAKEPGHGPVKTWYVLYYPRDKHGNRDGRPRRRFKLGVFPAMGVKAARDEARDVLARVHKGADPAEQRKVVRTTPTFADAVETYLGAINVAPRTHATYRLRLAKASKVWGKRPVNAITIADVRRLHGTLTAAGKEVDANRVVENLRTFFNWAIVEWPDHVTSNPAKFDRDKFKRNGEDTRERLISSDERQRLLAAIEAAEAKDRYAKGYLSTTHANAFRLALVTGMRPIDMVTLRHENISRAAIKGRKVWVATWPARGTAKTKKKGQRRVLNSEAIAIIEAQAEHTGHDGWVFPNELGKQTPSNHLSRAFRRMRDDAKLPADLTLYCARHTYVSEAVMAGIPLAVVGADVDNANAVHRYAHVQRAVDAGVSEQVLAVLRGEK